MSSFNKSIKFDLDIKEKNIVLKDYFYKMVQMKKHKIYEAELIQPACPYCGSLLALIPSVAPTCLPLATISLTMYAVIEYE